MGILLSLLIGLAVGGAAGFFLSERGFDHLLVNAVIGIAGSLLGLTGYFFLTAGTASTALFSLPAALCSILGALIFVLLLNGLHKIVPKRTAHQDHVEEDPIDEA